ncbi:hypothetical protein BGZ49_002341 [Haplosporangium sp. Z 27]|nr:hypothetical protein BGZ49_002341 [Haplosporangium sp. Z 27]
MNVDFGHQVMPAEAHTFKSHNNIPQNNPKSNGWYDIKGSIPPPANTSRIQLEKQPYHHIPVAYDSYNKRTSPGENQKSTSQAMSLYGQPAPPQYRTKDITAPVVTPSPPVKKQNSSSPEQKSKLNFTFLSEPSLSNEAKSKFRKSVHLYESYMKSVHDGKSAQAIALQDDFRKNMESLQADMIKHREMQRQMLEMQQSIFGLQQHALDRLALIKSRIQSILVQDLKWHECHIPRLFIILPTECGDGNEGGGSRGRNSSSPTFQLYFLCECGEHTKSKGSKLSHHIHVVESSGYSIESHTEFFKHFGTYVLSLLQMLKYGITVKGLSVPALQSTRGTGNESDDVFSHDHLGPRINKTIEYLQFLSKKGLIGPSTGYNQRESDFQELDGSDLLRLKSLLKVSDSSSVLGNLYRMALDDGNVKWVCPDHYNEAYPTLAMQDLSEILNDTLGVLDVPLGRVEITLQSSNMASHFYEVLQRSPFVQELQLRINWEVTKNDLKILRDVVCKTKIASLNLTCTPSNNTSDLMHRNKRSEPLWQMIIDAKLQSFVLSEYTGFFSRASIQTRVNQLSTLKISEFLDWKKDKDGAKLTELLRQSPRLKTLHLGCTNIDDAYSAIRKTTTGFSLLEHLVLDGGAYSGVSARFRRGEPVCMNLLISDMSSPILKYAQGLKSLHLRPLPSQAQYEIDPRFLEDIIANNPELTKLSIQCQVPDFQRLLMVVKEAISMNVSSKLDELTLYLNRNQLLAINLQKEASITLELMSTVNSDTLDSLLRVHGSRLTKLRIEGDSFKNLSTLSLNLQRMGTMLHHIEIASSFISPLMYRDLRWILKCCMSSLTYLSIVIYEPWEGTKTQVELADFIVEFGPLWTKIVVGGSELARWREAFRMKGFMLKDQIVSLAPSFARRMERLEGSIGLVPFNGSSSKLSTLKSNSSK